MKELTAKEEVESALGLSERFYILFFTHDKNNEESQKALNALESIEKERDDPYIFYFLIDAALAPIEKVECCSFFRFKPMFTLNYQDLNKEKLESLIPVFRP